MAAYLLRRLLLVVPTLLGIIVINFVVVQFAPGGPVEQMLAELRGAFDVILIDAPPILLVTDAAVIARRANGALVVAAAGKTTAPRLQTAIESIEKVGAKS